MKYQDFVFTKNSLIIIFITRSGDTISSTYVRILVLPWLLTWLANYKIASCSQAHKQFL